MSRENVEIVRACSSQPSPSSRP